LTSHTSFYRFSDRLRCRIDFFRCMGAVLAWYHDNDRCRWKMWITGVSMDWAPWVLADVFPSVLWGVVWFVAVRPGMVY